MKKTRSRKQKIQLTEEQKRQKLVEQKKKRKASAFRRKIKNIFIYAGFDYLNTTGIHMNIGRRVVEVDAVCFYENVLLICEDTTAGSKDKAHIRSKNEAFAEIDKNFSMFISQLIDRFPDYADKLKKYSEDRYLRFCLYFSMEEVALSQDEIDMYSNLKFIEPRILDYFSRMSQCIRLSAKYELFRYLKISKSQIGIINSGSGRKSITAPIIYPKDITGLSNGVRVVSFMMSAQDMLGNCYVLRKDNWEETAWLYQRLIDKKKIKNIRDFLAKKSEAFYNNVIVALPDNISFCDITGKQVPIDTFTRFESQCSIELPDELNSICVIDGQHRIFAHYEGPKDDKQEAKIAALRQQLHLLVTGLIFPQGMTDGEKAKIQSEIFLDINDKAKPVPPDVLLHIQMIKDPLSDIGLARRVIERLNKQGIFANKFEMSSLDEAKIKIASIIKFALRYLVTMTPAEGKASLYAYWTGDKNALEKLDGAAINEYIDFCAKNLDTFFCAVKNNNKDTWGADDSKLLSVISINGFIIAYNRQLKVNDIKGFDFYDEKLKKLSIDYSKGGFGYTSSQYRKFSDAIIDKAFGLDISEI